MKNVITCVIYSIIVGVKSQATLIARLHNFCQTHKMHLYVGMSCSGHNIAWRPSSDQEPIVCSLQ